VLKTSFGDFADEVDFFVSHLSRALDVASQAGRDEVRRGVVLGVPVEMVRHDDVGSQTLVAPVQRLVAPAARMFAGSDDGVEDETLFGDRAIRVSYWMAVNRELSALDQCFYRFAERDVLALRRAGFLVWAFERHGEELLAPHTFALLSRYALLALARFLIALTRAVLAGVLVTGVGHVKGAALLTRLQFVSFCSHGRRIQESYRMRKQNLTCTRWTAKALREIY